MWIYGQQNRHSVPGSGTALISRPNIASMGLSARNRLTGTITSVKTGQVMAEIVLELGDGQEVTSTITRESAERLDLDEGETVSAVIKASDVMIGTD